MIVEALAHGRRAIGFDINPLAVFVTRTKTTPLAPADWAAIGRWRTSAPLRQTSRLDTDDKRAVALPEQLRIPLCMALSRIGDLDTSRQRTLVRCALLKTTQWALESRDAFPAADALQTKLDQVVEAMRAGMDGLVDTARAHGVARTKIPGRRYILRASAGDAEARNRFSEITGKVRLVITSPPYPGVHVLYHRWQIRGRRETAAAFWIARHRDGFGPSYYTMGGRSEIGQVRYFERLTTAFQVLRPLLAPDALIVQIVGFSRADEQVGLFLSAMANAGYAEVNPLGSNSDALIRNVPNRRWYVRGKDLEAGKEHLLFHIPVY